MINGHAILERPRVMWFMSKDIPGVWDNVAPAIERGLMQGSPYTLQDIYDNLISGHMQLWTYGEFTYDAVLVTKCDEDCLLLTLSGYDMGAWLHHLTLIEHWAKQCDAKRMLIHGRKGWKRVLKGYNSQGKDADGWTILTKDL